MDPEQFKRFLVNALMHQRRAQMSQETTNLGTHYPLPPIAAEGHAALARRGGGAGIDPAEARDAVRAHLSRLYNLRPGDADMLLDNVMSGSWTGASMRGSRFAGIPGSDQLMQDAFMTELGTDVGRVQHNLHGYQSPRKYDGGTRGQE